MIEWIQSKNRVCVFLNDNGYKEIPDITSNMEVASSHNHKSYSIKPENKFRTDKSFRSIVNIDMTLTINYMVNDIQMYDKYYEEFINLVGVLLQSNPGYSILTQPKFAQLERSDARFVLATVSLSLGTSVFC